MKKISNNNRLRLFAFLLFFTVIAAGCKNKTAATDITYTCPMHPDVIKNEPSTCPICGMDLVRVHKHQTGSKEKLDLTDTLNNGIAAKVKTIHPKESAFRDTILLKGVISINTNNTKTLSSYTNGRIEKLYVKYNFQKISKGQKIMDIYSPDLVAAQQELLYLKKAGDFTLMNQAKRKLNLLGMSNQEIDRVLRTEKANYGIGVFSPFNGYIIESGVNTTESNTNTSNTPLNLRQGMYVNTGDILFKVFDDSTVWAEIYATATEAKRLKQNNDIEINMNSKSILSKISTIQPFYKEGQSFSNIRVQLNNANKDFKVGELLTAKVISAKNTGLWIPKSTVYQSGNRSIVFVKSSDYLYPKQISATTSGDKILVLKGLNKNDEIAENAAHLVDPEAFIYNKNDNE